MKLSTKFLLSLITALSTADVILALLGEREIADYFIWDAIIYLVTSLAFTNLSSGYKSALNKLSALIFAGFIFVVTSKLFQIIK